jgi:hypothetical protein
MMRNSNRFALDGIYFVHYHPAQWAYYDCADKKISSIMLGISGIDA